MRAVAASVRLSEEGFGEEVAVAVLAPRTLLPELVVEDLVFGEAEVLLEFVVAVEVLLLAESVLVELVVVRAGPPGVGSPRVHLESIHARAKPLWQNSYSMLATVLPRGVVRSRESPELFSKLPDHENVWCALPAMIPEM